MTTEERGSRIFEWVFVISVAPACWIILGFIFENLLERTLPGLLAVPAGLIRLGVLAVAFIGGWIVVRVIKWRTPFLQAPAGFEARDAIGPIIGWSLCAYLAVGIVLAMATYELVPRTDEHWALVVVGFGVWIPLYFAVPIGAVIAWFRIRGRPS